MAAVIPGIEEISRQGEETRGGHGPEIGELLSGVKRAFAFVMFLFTLSDAGSAESLPVLTIPTG